MNKIEQLFDDFFHSEGELQSKQIINEVLKLDEASRAEFFHIFISNLGFAKKMVLQSSILAKEHGKHEEFMKSIFG